LIEAWQGALAAEQQAVFGYSLLGPHLPIPDQAQAAASQAAHEQVRDAVSAAMLTVEINPVAPAADYPSLYPVHTSAQALALAPRLEDECGVAWRVLYLASALDPAAAVKADLPDVPARRREAQVGLTAAAVAAARWRKIAGVVPASRPFPGI
jgi:hypothetical protein